jgi:hypothetical protein
MLFSSEKPSLYFLSNRSRLGRRWGLLQDAMIMTLGLVMLTAAWGLTLNGWVICYAWSLFVYGVGVGKYLLSTNLRTLAHEKQVVNTP